MSDDIHAVEKLNLEISELVQSCRARCLWFAPADYQPQTDSERLVALQHIQKHGDKIAFVRARELQNWLLRVSKVN